MSNKNNNLTFKTWYFNQPAHLRGYIRQRLFEELQWSQDMVFNRMNRTKIKKVEMEKMNEIFDEKIFTI